MAEHTAGDAEVPGHGGDNSALSNSTTFSISSASDRTAKINQLLIEVLHRRANGEEMPDEQIIREHPELMPQLEEELRHLRQIHAAQKEAGAGIAAGEEPGSVTRDSPGPTSREDLPPPRVEGYEMKRLLNRGGQGAVYLAQQMSTTRSVAIKVLWGGAGVEEDHLQRFDREVKVLATLEHAGIVHIVDRGRTADGSHYFAMDYVRGRSLKTMVREAPRSAEDLVDRLRLFTKITDAINAAHLRGVVHRDLKPSNIMIDGAGEPHILDFGLATVCNPAFTDAEMSTETTMAGQFVGSLPWASPEQVDEVAPPLDVRSDVYSLGVILYQLLTGEFPYEIRGTMSDVSDHIRNTRPSPPSEVLRAAVRGGATGRRSRGGRPAGDARLDAIVLKALTKKPGERYQSAGEFSRDVGNYLDGRPISVEPAPRPSRLRSSLLIAAVALLAFAAGAVPTWWWLRQPSRLFTPPIHEAPAGDTIAAPGVEIETDTVGGSGGDAPFRETVPWPGHLIGLRITTRDFSGHEVVGSVQPVFRTPDRGEWRGGIYGWESEADIEVRANPGYAVGRIEASFGGRVDGFKVTFMRVRDRWLDPQDAYESSWVGGVAEEGDIDRDVIGQSGPRQLVVGIHGRRGGELDAFGLVLRSAVPGDAASPE